MVTVLQLLVMTKQNLEDDQTYDTQNQILMNLCVFFQTRVWDDFVNYSHRAHLHFVEKENRRTNTVMIHMLLLPSITNSKG